MVQTVGFFSGFTTVHIDHCILWVKLAGGQKKNYQYNSWYMKMLCKINQSHKYHQYCRVNERELLKWNSSFSIKIGTEFN
jgi:hypothetical protein